MNEEEIQAGLDKYSPFLYVIDLPYGFKTSINPKFKPSSVPYTRIRNLVQYAFLLILEVCSGSFEGKKILDLGCNCGGFSFEAAKLGAKQVIGIDVNRKFIKQADFLERIFRYYYKWKVHKVTFYKGDIEKGIITDFTANSDIVFCFGLLYHFENPVKAMQNITAVTKDILVVDTIVHRQKMVRFQRASWITRIANVSWSNKPVYEMVPNEAAVIELLKFVGFNKIEKIDMFKCPDKRYQIGSRVTYIAKK